MSAPKLRFCPESNDLLYPKEDRERKKLVYHCRNCGYQEDVAPGEWCVYRNEVHHTAKEKNVVLQVMRKLGAGVVCAARCSRRGFHGGCWRSTHIQNSASSAGGVEERRDGRTLAWALC